MESTCKVCVTGDQYKVGLLRSLPHADTRLKLYEADIYNPNEFKHAIEGCELVVQMATPLPHQPLNSQFRDTFEVAVAGVNCIVESCVRSGTVVKKLIYTASVTIASPLKEDGKGFKDSMNESCWTPLPLRIPHSTDSLMVVFFFLGKQRID